MAGQVRTVNDLVSDVRSMLDEQNRSAVDTDIDILPALNRAQDFAVDILARQYEEPLLQVTLIPTVAGQTEYDIPEGALEQRLEKVEVNNNGLFYPVTRIDYRDISLYETQSPTSIPQFYAVRGRSFRLVPKSTGTFGLRLWWLQDPRPLVLSQGRITLVNEADQYIRVDEVGSDLTTEQDQLDSYVNLIDGQTGGVKGTFQIQSIVDNKITFKTVPTRTEVLGQTVDTDLADLTDDSGNAVQVEPDDFICVAKGGCIPFLKKPLGNFLIQYAVAEITRKLGGSAELEERILEKFEKQVERLWVGQEQSLRVTKRSSNWDFPVRRYWGIRN